VIYIMTPLNYFCAAYLLMLIRIALAVREIFTGVHKFKSRSHNLCHIPFDLVFACRQTYSYAMHTPNLKSLAIAVP